MAMRRRVNPVSIQGLAQILQLRYFGSDLFVNSVSKLFVCLSPDTTRHGGASCKRVKVHFSRVEASCNASPQMEREIYRPYRSCETRGRLDVEP